MTFFGHAWMTRPFEARQVIVENLQAWKNNSFSFAKSNAMIYEHLGDFHVVLSIMACVPLGMITCLSGKLLAFTCNKASVVTAAAATTILEPHLCPRAFLTSL
jgi:hypothetical protein